MHTNAILCLKILAIAILVRLGEQIIHCFMSNVLCLAEDVQQVTSKNHFVG